MKNQKLQNGSEPPSIRALTALFIFLISHKKTLASTLTEWQSVNHVVTNIMRLSNAIHPKHISKALNAHTEGCTALQCEPLTAFSELLSWFSCWGKRECDAPLAPLCWGETFLPRLSRLQMQQKGVQWEARRISGFAGVLGLHGHFTQHLLNTRQVPHTHQCCHCAVRVFAVSGRLKGI